MSAHTVKKRGGEHVFQLLINETNSRPALEDHEILLFLSVPTTKGKNFRDERKIKELAQCKN
jgi:hypothetical protein